MIPFRQICIQARPSEYHDIRSRNRRSPPLIAGSTNTGHERYRPTRPDKRNIGDYPEGEKEQEGTISTKNINRHDNRKK